MDLDAVRRQMPVTRQWIYLNHAAVAPVSGPAARAMRRLIRDAELNGIVHYDHWNRLYAQARRSVAALIGAQADEVAFLKNTSDGLIAVANGVRWSVGDNVVLSARDFPANVYPWLNLRSRGVEVRLVPERDGRLPVGDFAAAVDARTRVLSASSVSFLTGFRQDLGALGQLCRSRGSLFVVDAIQSLGAFPLQVAELGIDCLAADGHKWLMGPEGCALFYCGRQALERLEVASLGWASVASAYDFLSYDTALQPDARRFETGTHTTAGIAGLKAAVEFLSAQGIPAIAARILELTDQLCAGLERKGYTVHSPRGEHERSGIVSCSGRTRSAVDLDRLLRGRRIVGSVRGDWLRLSPHFYNTAEEIEQVLSALPPA
jgi:selenocysteine lyase/cysteine desulfurase